MGHNVLEASEGFHFSSEAKLSPGLKAALTLPKQNLKSESWKDQIDST